jgi:hypothetical protein
VDKEFERRHWKAEYSGVRDAVRSYVQLSVGLACDC